MKPMYESVPSAQESADTTEGVEVPNEHRLVCAECGADGGTYSFSVPHDAPEFCPWCGNAVDGDTTATVAGDSEATGLSDGGNL